MARRRSSPGFAPLLALAALASCSGGFAAASGTATVLKAPPATTAAVPQQTLMEFQWNGHVATRGLLTREELQEAAGPLRWLVEEEGASAAARKTQAMRGSGTGAASPGSGSDQLPFVQVHNPHKRSAAARRLAFAPVLAATAAALLGVARVRLYQDSLFWKRPGAGDATAWHADLWTVPISTNRFVTVWLPLHRVGAEGSPLYYRSRDEEEGGVEIADLPAPGLAGVHHAPLEEGDATWHHGWTLHGAPPLREGAGERLAYTAAFFSDDEPVVGEALDELAARRRGHSFVEVESASAPSQRRGRSDGLLY